MAYDKNKIFLQAKEVIVKHKLFFIEDIVCFLPCDKTTFYRFFEPESNEYNELKELLDQQKMELKVSMRSKWYKSENATLQITLMKLICTDDERKKMSVNYTENEHKFDKESPLIIDWNNPIDLDNEKS
jgi:hypothetical protein